MHTPTKTRPELIIGLVGPIGTPLDSVDKALGRSLESVGYEKVTIDLMELAREVASSVGISGTFPTKIHDRYLAKMGLGNDLRESTELGDVLALLGMAEIKKIRDQRLRLEDKSVRPAAYVLLQLKNPYELAALQQTYGDNCVILSAYAPKVVREDALARRIARSMHEQTADEHRARALQLIARDLSEPKRAGQNVEEAFPLGDVFVDAGAADRCQSQVTRLVEIIFQHPVRTPRREEFGMFQAYGSGLRSADWGRQVGAAICTSEGHLVSLGVNEVPQAHGGQYWEEDDESLDNRDWKRPQDSNAQIIRSILADLLQRMKHHKCLTAELMGSNLSDPDTLIDIERKLTGPVVIEKSSLGSDAEYDVLSRSLQERAQIRNLIEYYRAVHAEMSALASAALRGVSVRGCTLYVTAFPCHECAKHIVAAGICCVVFIEPYPKSRVPDLYDDSIRVDAPGDRAHIGFEAYVGVAPRRYTSWFLMPDRKTGTGWVEWESVRGEAQPRNAREFSAYERAEEEKIAELQDALKRLQVNSPKRTVKRRSR